MKKVVTILGTRPEIIKMSALISLLDNDPKINHILVHTGQHYDYNMDRVFFDELKLKQPHSLNQLNVGSHSQGKQTGMMLEKIEEILVNEKPAVVIVQGDTNSTLAGALAASKLGIKVMHVEAGCRSFNRNMPEEINRVLVDHVSTYLIAPDEQSVVQLKKEGIPSERIFQFGSTAFDAVLRNKELSTGGMLDMFGLEKNNYVIITLHRAQTDDKATLTNIVSALNELAECILLVFPLHPRTRKNLERFGLTLHNSIRVIEPQPYLSFLSLLAEAKFCISDSGGIQEEAALFHVPCLIPRNETEWMRLVESGKNRLIGVEKAMIVAAVRELLDNEDMLCIMKEAAAGNMTGASSKIMELVKRDS
jgi:UDP-N-acetylglucosamine 2-epimerase